MFDYQGEGVGVSILRCVKSQIIKRLDTKIRISLANLNDQLDVS
jgi:hypothetical protein